MKLTAGWVTVCIISGHHFPIYRAISFLNSLKRKANPVHDLRFIAYKVNMLFWLHVCRQNLLP